MQLVTVVACYKKCSGPLGRMQNSIFFLGRIQSKHLDVSKNPELTKFKWGKYALTQYAGNT